MVSTWMLDNQVEPLGLTTLRELTHPDFDPEDPNSYQNSPAVEVDEYLAYHSPGEGRKRERQVWVLGIHDRATQEVRTFYVKDRTEATLLPILQAHIANDPLNPTRVYTDGWSAYNSLASLGYDHHVVPHNQGFGIGSETTNHIESFWAQIRDLIEFEYGIVPYSEEEIHTYLNSATWRIKYRESDLQYMLAMILSIYQVNMAAYYDM